MGRFLVKEGALQSHISEMEDIGNCLKRIQADVLSVRSGLTFQVSSVGQLKTTLDRLALQTEEQRRSVSGMKNAAVVISDTYFQTESEVKDRVGGKKGGVVANGSGSGMFLGVAAAGELSGDLLGYEQSGKQYAEWNTTKGNIKAAWERSATGYVAKGNARGNIGILSGEATGTVLKGTAKSGIYAELMKDGKFAPKVGVEGKVDGSVLEGDVKAQIGNDNYNVHGEAKGNALGGEAKGGLGLGNIGTDENGKTKYGAKGEVSAEVYAAKGEIKGGFTILGIDFDYGVAGKAGAIGAKAGGEISNQGFSVDAGLSAILGLEGRLSVDWSDFELPEFEWPEFNLW